MITTAQPKQKLTFGQFLEQYLENGHYELIKGELLRIFSTRQHDDVADFIADEMKAEVKQHKLNDKVSDRIVLATATEDGQEQGRHPDVSVVDLDLWRSDRFAYTALRETIQLTVEVISTNWEDDYIDIDKLDEYQRLGIREYWIVDYLALGSRTYLGNPKKLTVFVYLLDNNQKYKCTRFHGSDPIISQTFPQLKLSVEKILPV